MKQGFTSTVHSVYEKDKTILVQEPIFAAILYFIECILDADHQENMVILSATEYYGKNVKFFICNYTSAPMMQPAETATQWLIT